VDLHKVKQTYKHSSLYIRLSPSLRIVDPCRIGLVRVMCSSLVCGTGGHLWLLTAVRVTHVQYNRIVAQSSRLHYRVLTSFSYCQREEQKATGKNQSETDSSEARHDALGGTQTYKQIEVIILPLAILQCNLAQILVNTG
jgi:hypothetical protein